ncbi:MAG TPA: hypothetical protein VKD72_36180, partial [Gemmataceae bacterium]|nr:hypothetical protein [Gemmataceae bacterium]
GKLLGPDDKPVRGAIGYGLYWNQTPNAESRRVDTLTGSSFEASTLDPLKTYTLSFVHKQRKLIGHAVVRGDAKGPLTVRLQRWGTLTGRLVDDAGKPLAGVRVGLKYPDLPEPGARPPDGEFHSDAEGRFRVEGLLPGLKHELALGSDGKRTVTPRTPDRLKDLSTAPGEVKDLGEVRVKVVPVK